MDRARNLLFGLFAVELNKTTPDELADIGFAYQRDSSRDLPDLMIDAKIIEGADRDFINDVVESAVSKKNGDAEKALEGLGGEDQVNESFLGTVTIADPRSDSVVAVSEPTLGLMSSAVPAGGDGSASEENEEEAFESEANVQTVAAGSLDDDDDVDDDDATVMALEGSVDESLDPSRTVGLRDGPDEMSTSTAGPGATIVSAGLPGDPDAAKSTKVTSSVSGEFFTDPNATKRVLEAEGRYTRESEHARGGMGRILLVHDEHLGRDVALKELLPELAEVTVPGFSGESTAQPMLSRFLQEARLTGRLEHPSIVPVYELGQRKDGTYYYTMKLLRGKSMADVINATKTLNERLELLPRFVDMCQAVAYAHSKGVIHRDLKPDNVMVGEFGETVVIDWGLAKSKSEREISTVGAKGPKQSGAPDLSKTAYGQALGTPAYMPPEQAKGELDKIDERSDVYSLGAVLYELLTRQLPIKGKSLDDALRKVIEEDPKPIREIEPDVRPELAAIVERAMSKAPKNRYRSAKELADDVQRFLSGALVRVYEYKTSEVIMRWIRKHKMIVGTVFSAVVALVVISGFYVDSILKANAEIEEQRDDLADKNVVLEEQKQELRVAGDLEIAQRKRIERRGYHVNIQLARSHLAADTPSNARVALEKAPKQWRNWEWGYLYNILDPSRKTLIGHMESVSDVAFSPRGNHLATASEDHTVRIWDVKTGEELATLRGHTRPVNSVVYRADGSRILTASSDGSAIVWNASTGQEIRYIAAHDAPVNSATYSADGRRIVTASADGTAKIWDANSGEELLKLDGHDSSSVEYAVFAPSGNQVATASADNSVVLWNASSGTLLRRLEREGQREGHRETINQVQYSPDGSRLLTASDDTTAKLWDVQSGSILATLIGHTNRVTSARFNETGTKIVTASNDNRVKVWRSNGDILKTFSGHDETVNSAAFSPDEKWLATGSVDRTVKLWDAEDESRVSAAKGHTSLVQNANFNPDGTRFVTASFDRTAIVWDSETREKIFTLAGHTDAIYDALYSSDGKQIITSSGDATAKVWNAETGELVRTLVGHSDGVFYAAFNADSSRIVTAAWTQAPRVWDGATGEELFRLAIHIEPVTKVAFDPEGKTIATGSRDGELILWDANDGEPIRRMTGHGREITSLEFSPDGTRILTTSRDRTAKIWEVRSGVDRFTLHGHTDEIFDGAFSPDGLRIVTGSFDGTAKVWNAVTGAEEFTLVGHSGRIERVMFNNDGTRIVTVSRDNTVKVWESAAEIGEDPRTLRVQGLALLSATFSPFGRHIVSTYSDGSAYLWSAAPWRENDWEIPQERARISKVNSRLAPKVTRHDFQIDRTYAIDQLSLLADNFLETKEAGGQTVSFLETEGGLIVDVVEERAGQEPKEAMGSRRTPVNFFPQLNFKDQDLLFKINNEKIVTRTQANETLRAFIESLQANRSEPRWLRLDVYNYLEHNVVIFHFSGIIGEEITLKQAPLIGIFDISLQGAERYIERNLRQTLAQSGLKDTDRITLFNGDEVPDYDSWMRALAKTKASVQDGRTTYLEVVAFRNRTDQYLVIGLNVDRSGT